MASITIRGLDEDTKSRLRILAARHGRSTEAEARAILDAATADTGRDDRNLGSELVAIFAGAGPIELPERDDFPRAPDLS
jgi:antitoxin FitA